MSKKEDRNSSNEWILWAMIAGVVILSSALYVFMRHTTGDALLSAIIWIVVALVLSLSVRQIWIQLDSFKGKRVDSNLEETGNAPDTPTIIIENKVEPTPVTVQVDNHFHPRKKPDNTKEVSSKDNDKSPAFDLNKQESDRIWCIVDNLTCEEKCRLPEKLRDRDALFVLVMIREAGYLDNEFLPKMLNSKGEIHMTNYSFIANAISCALYINYGKWSLFEQAWNLKNARNLYEKIKKPDMSVATPFEIDVINVLRKARKLNPHLDTPDLQHFINKCPETYS